MSAGGERGAGGGGGGAGPERPRRERHATTAAPAIATFPTLDALSRAAAERVVAAAAEAVGARGRFLLVLSGGSTPRALYALLAAEHAERLPWARTEIFFGDERCVPPDDPASNFRMVREALLAHVAVLPAQVHRIAGERGPRDAAARYEAELRRRFGDVAAPAFDLTLLGVGADGHTASLFPGDEALAERTRWVRDVAAPPAYAPRARITLTLPVLNASRAVLFLAAGAEKRDAVRRALAGDAALPAAHVRGARTTWLLDAAAAGGPPPLPPGGARAEEAS